MGDRLVKAALRAGQAVLEEGLSLGQVLERGEVYSQVLGQVLVEVPSSRSQLEALVAVHRAVLSVVAVSSVRARAKSHTVVRRNILKAYLLNCERGGQ